MNSILAIFPLIVFVNVALTVRWMCIHVKRLPRECPDCRASLPMFRIPFCSKKIVGNVRVVCSNCRCEIGIDGKKVSLNSPAIGVQPQLRYQAFAVCAVVACLLLVWGINQVVKIPILPRNPVQHF